MIDLQLIDRGISDIAVISAFSEIDREDFIPHKNRKQAYADIELLSFSNDRVILRCFVLAKIVEYVVVNLKPKSCLVVGDFSGYTSEIFSRVCEKCTIGQLMKKEIQDVKKVLQSNISIDSFENIVSKKQDKFDFVFFDAGFYKNSTIKKASALLTECGSMIYFSKKQATDLSENQFEFTHTTIIKATKNQIEDLFCENILFSPIHA